MNRAAERTWTASFNTLRLHGVRKVTSEKRPRQRASVIAKGLFGVLVAVGLWELVRVTGLIESKSLPSFFAIVGAGSADIGGLLRATGGTLGVWVGGLLLATVIGVLGGVALALIPPLERVTRPIVEFIRPIPSVALIPIALIVLGLGFQMEIALITFASIWPVLFSTKTGVEGVDPRFVETGIVLGLRPSERLFKIILPNALPAVATGIRTAAAIALVLAITVEMLVGQKGLGYYLQFARLNGQAENMWAATAFAGLIGLLLNTVFLLLERRIFVWSAENRVS